MGSTDTTVRWSVVQRTVERKHGQLPRLMRGWLLNRPTQRAAAPGMTQPLSARALRRQIARETRRAARAKAQAGGE